METGEDIFKKRFNPKVEEVSYCKPDMKLSFLNRKKVPYLMYRTGESTTIITENTKYRFYHGRSFPINKMNLFMMVKRDAKKWLKVNPNFKLPKRVLTEKTNDYNTDKNIVGCDINHAYWRIAYVHGIISLKTYEYGLGDKCKRLRLASISILGRQKRYQVIENGKRVSYYEAEQGDEKLREIYKYCRYFCYEIMDKVSKLLKNDFDSYKIDCVYFTDSPENRKLVSDFFDSHNLTYKWLTEYDDDTQ